MTDLVIFNDIRPYIPQWDSKDYLEGCRIYAKEYEVYLVPARVVVDGMLFLCLIDPKGDMVGVQGATHLNLSTSEKLERETKVEVLDTPLGKIFLCVDVDIYNPAVLRLAALGGAQIVISSQYIDSYQFSKEMVKNGVWNAAQQNNFFVVGCCNHFKTVAAPMELTTDGSGYVAPPCTEKNLYCKLFLNKLEKTKNLPAPLENTGFLQAFAGFMIRE